MGKLLPIILIVLGISAGGAAGFFLRPEPAPPTEEELAAMAEMPEPEKEALNPDDLNYNKMSNQFVVPIVDGNQIVSLVLLSISLETPTEETDRVFKKEPKIRDAFLRVLFDHAYAGGFQGPFTASPVLDSLAAQLLKAGKEVTDGGITDVLITEIMRQDN